MAFSFGGTSTPAFGATSTPSFSFAGASAPSPFAASTPAFGAAAPSPFAAPSSTPAFAASSPSLFGATATPAPSPLGAVSTPAFSFASASAAAPLFGASSTPAFGATPFGASTGTPSLFGASQTPSLFTNGAPTALGFQQQPQQQLQIPQLVTKDNRPISHSTKWDDLSPQAQHYLLELDTVISSYRDDCIQLDNEERLQQTITARREFEDSMKLLSQKVASLALRVKADAEETETIRTAVVNLLRHTETAVHAFKKTRAWREAARSAPGQPLPMHVAELIGGGPIALPSQFLIETIESLQERLRNHESSASMLETALLQSSTAARHGGVLPVGGDATKVVASLHAAISNVHDCLVKTAAQQAGLVGKMERAKASALFVLQQSGNVYDPFEEAERRESLEERKRKDSKGAMEGHMEYQQQQQQQQQVPIATVAQAQTTAATTPPTGLFGTAPVSPTGTGLFGSIAPSNSRRRGR